jgi:rod shape-determining protein MreC|tara:strand:+ start:1473 stop:2321 length:849 start_codon:yes stop_codon:yes gene_type:complete
MDTNRDDFGIAVRSAFLSKGTQQKFSLFALIILSIIFLLIEKIETKPLNYFRSIVKDTIYRGSFLASLPTEGLHNILEGSVKHITIYKKYDQLKEENDLLKNSISKSDYLSLENKQLKKLIEEEVNTNDNFTSARVMIDKKSPYLNSFIISSGSNKKIKNGMAVLDGQNFIGRIVDVNFFSSRVLLISDLNSKVPIIVEPSGNQAILSGHGSKKPTLEYLPENYGVKDGDTIYTSGKEGIFKPGIPIGKIKLEKYAVEASLFSNLNQITFVNINLSTPNTTK